MNLMTRQQTEDFFHDVISKMLPKIEKSNIRPAFQKTKQPNMAGKNYISQGDDINNGLEGFTNTDDFAYFRVIFDERNENEAEVTLDNNVSIVRKVDLTVYLYGDNSANNALIIKALLRAIHIQDYLISHGYYQVTEGNITPMFEDIHGEWWERNDITIQFEYRVEIEPNRDEQNVIATGYNQGLPAPKTVVDGEERK